jgi:hypothetical protein
VSVDFFCHDLGILDVEHMLGPLERARWDEFLDQEFRTFAERTLGAEVEKRIAEEKRALDVMERRARMKKEVRASVG